MSNLEIIYNTLKDQKIPDPLAKIMTSQAQLESANFTSNVFKTNKNAYGYKYVKQKIATQGLPAPKNEGGFYANYKSVSDSALELANYVKRREKEKKFPGLETITSARQYAELLTDVGYHTATRESYVKGVEYYYNKIKDLVIKNTTPLLSIAILIGVFFLINRKR
jgi:uncharacterized FlgJ-related protein